MRSFGHLDVHSYENRVCGKIECYFIDEVQPLVDEMCSHHNMRIHYSYCAPSYRSEIILVLDALKRNKTPGIDALLCFEELFIAAPAVSAGLLLSLYESFANLRSFSVSGRIG